VSVGTGAEWRGVVLVSDHGQDRAEAARLPHALEDVAYGDGRWIAVGGDRSASQRPGSAPPGEGAIYTSTDDRAWQRVVATAPSPVGVYNHVLESIAHHDRGCIASGAECGGAACSARPSSSRTTELSSSAPGTAADGELHAIDFSADENTIAMVGTELASLSDTGGREPPRAIARTRSGNLVPRS
jgi:hypothetical protein